MVDPVLFVPLAFIAVVWLMVIALSHPRKLLYLAIALCPTQFLFFPVSTFFLSPADVLVAGSSAGLLVRLAALQTAPWRALFKHRFLVLMICSYAIGFV